ncbi:MAG: porin [Pseudomonadota bacterium]
MRKFLVGTTALVGMTIGGAASASDVELGLGGYMRVGMAFSDYVEQAGSDRNPNAGEDPGTFGEADNSFHIIRDGEIHFKGSGTLDNGISIDARVELEAYTHDSDQIDENWVRVRSSFGSILIGANDDAAYNTGYVGFTQLAPNFAVMDGTLTFVPTTVNAQFSLVGGSDAQGIHYYTPNIAGFSAGISYHPQLSTDAGSDAQATGGNNDADIIAIGAQYANSFGDFDFAIGGGYVTLDGDAISEAVTAPAGGGALVTTETRTDLELDSWGVGVEVGFAGFGIQGRYEELDSEEDGVDSADVQAYQIGATYGTGPWTFGAGYGHWEDDETDAEDSTIKGGVTYSLGKGVTLGGVIEWGEADDGTEEEDGVAGAILLGVSF